MSRFDRYLLSQFLALFGFFSLVLVAVYWVNRAVSLFDQLIGDGQSALVFIEFSLLTLPNVIRLVLPISAFAGCVYAVNRLMQESELVVMQATGFSAMRLARPVIFFGLCVCAMQLMLTNLLVPLSQSQLNQRTAEISENITARFLNAGRFMYPTDGVTLYIREITPQGELNDLLLADERTPGETITYTARQALIVKDQDQPQLLMIDGMVQTINTQSRRMAITRFADFGLDMANIIGVNAAQRISLRETSTWALITQPEALSQEYGWSVPVIKEELHSRFSGPLLGLAAPLLGFAALMLGGYSRFGIWKQITFAVLLLIGVQVISTTSAAAALKSANAWPLVYLAPVTGICTAFILLWWGQRPKHIKPTPLPEGEA